MANLKSIHVLVLEDDLKTLSVIMDVLARQEQELKNNFVVTVYSTFRDVENIVNRGTLGNFDIILLDRDCKLGGSFHVLEMEKLDTRRIIAISAIPQYNQDAVVRGVLRVVTKDHDHLDVFAMQLSEQIIGLISQ